MLLGRTANGVFWMHRYIERADNMARILDAGLRISLTRSSDSDENWRSVLNSAGCGSAFDQSGGVADASSVTNFILRDRDNASSVISSIEAARSNARMVRTALTREVWEATNDAWMVLRDLLQRPVKHQDLPDALDQIKQQAAYIRGAFQGTMLRNEIFDFARLGTYIERADNTARILDVKYYVLLPSVALVGSALDNFQWESILRSVSAHRAYRWEYEGEYKSAKIADFLILNPRMPRSLAFCARNVSDNLGWLEKDYGIRHDCHDMADDLRDTLRSATIETVFDQGLHEFLSSYIAKNNDLGSAIAKAYRFYE